MELVRMITLNVLDFAVADGSARRQVIAAGLRAEEPDVVALQEVDVRAADQIVSELLGENYSALAHPSTAADGVGGILASRWPIRLLDVVDLRITGRVRDFPWTLAVMAAVQLPPPVGLTMVVHTKPAGTYLLEREREQQAVVVARAVDAAAVREGVEHVVILGDFDAAPDSASMRFWTGRQSLADTSVCYLDAWEFLHPDQPGHTFTRSNPLVASGTMPFGPDRRIDYVLVRSGSHGPTLEIRRADLLFVEPQDGIKASDHYGLVVDLAPPDRPAGRWSPSSTDSGP